MTLASKITLIRVAMIPAYLAAMYLSGGTAGPWMWAGLAIFILASLTDYIDGQIARRCNQVSDFGKFLDPLADKLLTIAAMSMFCEWGRFPAWALMIVLTREFAVSGLRMVASGKGRVIAAAWSGKMKTAITMSGICLMLCLNTSVFEDLLGACFLTVFNWVVVIAISVVTLYSGVEYFIKNIDILKEK